MSDKNSACCGSSHSISEPILIQQNIKALKKEQFKRALVKLMEIIHKK